MEKAVDGDSVGGSLAFLPQDNTSFYYSEFHSQEFSLFFSIEVLLFFNMLSEM